MAAKTFEGAVSIVLNSKGEIALKRDAQGKFTASDAVEIFNKMREFSKSKKATINQYSLFTPKDGTEPVLLANRYGNPYIALLPKREDGGGNKRTVTKLA
jgi:hypothetical protein